jgi:hypothetical protein
MNGAGVIHDVELALAGKTSEDVAARLPDGPFGMARETAQFVHDALADGVSRASGTGASVGKAIASSKARRGISGRSAPSSRGFPEASTSTSGRRSSSPRSS